jgi:hypothetical protein
MPTDKKIQNSAEMKQKMYAFLADLVPDSMRGKETGRHVKVPGAISLFTVEYEYVAVSETEYAKPNEVFRRWYPGSGPRLPDARLFDGPN